MTDNKKVLFEDLEIGEYFKAWDMLFVKTSYDRVDYNAFCFEVNYTDLINDDKEVEVVEKVEIKIPE